MNPFICTYTNKCKDYCDKMFFHNFHQLAGDYKVCIIDNTPGMVYMHSLSDILSGYNWKSVRLENITVDPEPSRTIFLRSVSESAEKCRQLFLESDCDHMLIVESDVVPPKNVVRVLYNHINKLPDNWGAIGVLYYPGFHDYEKVGVHETTHTLSGCTLYNRKMLEQTPFRWDPNNIHAFPDFWMSYDAIKNGYLLYNDHSVRCDHLHNPKNGGRIS